MNKPLAIAALLTLGLNGVHIFAGGADVHAPLLQSDASEVNKGFVSVLWHAVTANLSICAGMLAIAAFNPKWAMPLSISVLAQFVAMTVLFLGYGMARFGTVMLMPPWIGFVVLSFVVTLGLFTQRRPVSLP